jgi:hypothetical protein
MHLSGAKVGDASLPRRLDTAAGWRAARLLLTRSGHEQAAFAAMHGPEPALRPAVSRTDVFGIAI